MSRGDQLRRQWAILNAVSGARVSRRELARRFAVSRKTITRDLEALTMFPIVEEREGVEVYYQLLRGARTPPLQLEERELAALLLSERTLLAALDDTPYRADVAAALEKLALLQREHAYRRLRALPDVLLSSFEKSAAPTDHHERLLDAARRRRRVWLDYHTAERGRDRERVVEPYYVHLHPHGRHLVAYCLERQDFMYFDIHCVRALRVLEQGFDPSARPLELDDFLATVFDGQRGLPVLDVHLRIYEPTARWARDRFYHRSQRVEPFPGGVELRFRAGAPRAIAARVLGLGPDCEVISPPSLRARVAALARGVLARAGPHDQKSRDPGPDLSRAPASVTSTPPVAAPAAGAEET